MVRGQKGQALPVVLILLVLGGLLIVPTLSYASTSLKGHQVSEVKTKGIYAADAGIENALRYLISHGSLPPQLDINVNTMNVITTTQERGSYTIAASELVSQKDHSNYLEVWGEMELVVDDTYNYTITVHMTDEATGEIKLKEVGVRLPLGYTYETDSASLFGGNLSLGEPTITLDGAGARMLTWELQPPRPTLKKGEIETRTQKFHVTGTGDHAGDYTWVVAVRSDVETVGEVNGTLYEITATAILDEDPKAIVVTDVINQGGDLYIPSWQITK